MPEVADDAGEDQPVLRVSLDVNSWIAYLIALQHGRRDVASVELVDVVCAMRARNTPVQLVMSLEMLGTIERVLIRQGFAESDTEALTEGIVGLMKAGPETLDPYLLVSGRDQLAMRDREDAGVLGVAMAAQVDVLVTDNLRDFRTQDAEVVETRRIAARGGGYRQLFALIHERDDQSGLVVAHPFDVVEWFRDGLRPSPGNIRQRYGPPV